MLQLLLVLVVQGRQRKGLGFSEKMLELATLYES